MGIVISWHLTELGNNNNAQQYTIIHNNTKQYTTIHDNSQQCTMIQNNTQKYTAIDNNTQQCTKIHNNIRLLYWKKFFIGKNFSTFNTQFDLWLC